MKHLRTLSVPRKAQSAKQLGFLDVLADFFEFVLIVLEFKTQDEGTLTK